MTSAPLTRPRAPSVALLVDFAADRGVSSEACLRSTGLHRSSLTSPDLVVSAAQELTVIANIVAALGDPPGLGIEAGVRYHVTTHGMWGYALISSPTLHSAIDHGLRYLELSFSHCRITAHEEGDAFSLVIDPALVPAPVRRFVAERDIGIIDALHRELVGKHEPLLAVQLPYPDPGKVVTAELRHVIGARLEFGAGRYAASFDRSRVNDPLPLAEPHTAAMAEQQCRELLERHPGSTGVASQVRSLLLGNPARPPTSDQVAAALYLTSRTLRRRLTEESSSYRMLLDEVRHEVAVQLLHETRLSVAEVAERLGYSETASFTHAFRRWTGGSPRAHRLLRVGGGFRSVGVDQ